MDRQPQQSSVSRARSSWHGFFLSAALAAVLASGAGCSCGGGTSPDEAELSFGVLGMPEGAVRAMAAGQAELSIRVTHLAPRLFAQEPLPDLSVYDALFTAFPPQQHRDRYGRALAAARAKNDRFRIFCVGPGPVCESWSEWVGPDGLVTDPTLAAYYGLSAESMKQMLRCAAIRYFGRSGEVVAPGSGPRVTIHHPALGRPSTIDELLERARQAGRLPTDSPRVALASWRHHVLFHQPKVLDALISELEAQGLLAVCLVADDPGFRERLKQFAPDLVILTSHTQEPPEFWQELGVPRLHALWFMDEPLERWQRSTESGMSPSSIFHQLASAELKGATEGLTSGGTRSGMDSDEEILPIPDRLRRIAGRARSWITLARKENPAKKLAVVVYDLEADKAGLMSGPAHNLNAPRSMMRFLAALQQRGYGLADLPADEEELLARLADHGRQMGAWEPAALARLADSGRAVLVPESRYRRWFEEKVPRWRQEEVIARWGPVPGEIMVHERNGTRFLVLPQAALGNVTLVTQPLKGETITASAKVQDPHASLLPPTHHFLATYFWIQEELRADALVHFGSHGSEWLFPGKPAVLAAADWGDILIGDLPNINPWLASNTAELLPCKRRARAVTIGFLPALLAAAGLSDELANLQSLLEKHEALAPGALRDEFAADITRRVRASRLDRDLGFTIPAGGSLDPGQLAQVSRYLHDLGNELVPAHMHVLGERPPDELVLPWLVHVLGRRFGEAARPLFPDRRGAAADGEHAQPLSGGWAAAVLASLLREGRTPEEAIRAAGGQVPADGLPQAVREGLELAMQVDAGLASTHRELDSLLEALDGRFVPPGPAGNPERNPGVVPTGRNLYLLNPQELPSRASWELGTRLIERYLAQELQAKGRYPRKVAFSLVPYATYSDFGIIEAQILYLIGVRPVWDAKERVRDVELIPASELGRPRIDVFLSARSVYRDELPALMKLLDRAIRLAAAAEEEDNFVHRHSVATRRALEAQGVPPEKALALSQARMFGAEPREVIDSHDWFFYLTERSGEWESRQELLEVYLEHNRHVYTEGVWGEDAPAAFDEAIRGTELILRSWYDARDHVLANKFAWWVDGTLSMAVEHATGQRPGYLFVDVRDPEQASIVDAAAVVRKDLRARLTNERWIRSMMAEGYAGASAITRSIDNLMGWEITREQSVDDADWNELVDLYVRDRRGLGMRSWFASPNPHAFQKLSATLLETIRKGFWQADEATRQELAAAFAASVVAHGRGGGLREGGNRKLHELVAQTLRAPGEPELERLAQDYLARLAADLGPVARAAEAAPQPAADAAVVGLRLEKQDPARDGERAALGKRELLPFLGLLAGLVVLAGFVGQPLLERRRNPTP